MVDWLKCLTENHGDTAIVRVQGEIDLASVPLLRHELEGALTMGGHVIVDLREVSYLDMKGVRLLEEVHGRFRDQGRVLVVASPRPVLRRVLELVEFDRLTPILDSTEAAVEFVRGAQR